MLPDMIVLHYTGMPNAYDALQRLRSPGSEVSCHYFVFEDGRIIQLVPEERRAWHAGFGSWEGETDVNSRSIGIEIANPGHDYGYPEFPRRQIAAVTALCRGIIAKRKIARYRVLAHSDVAPARKQDPGEKFPWKVLHDSGVALWVPAAPIVDEQPFYVLGDRAPEVEEMQRQLREIGYGVSTNGNCDAETMAVIGAFQRHYRPTRVDGIADLSTRQTIARLLDALREIKGQATPATAGEPL